MLDSETYRHDVMLIARLPLDWGKLAGARVVVSGASGMIGSFLIDVLMARDAQCGQGCTIHALARDARALEERFASYAGDPRLVVTSTDVTRGPIELSPGTGGVPAGERVTDELVDAGALTRPCYIIHAASNTHPVAYATDPIGTITANVEGTLSMLRLARRMGARRAVFLSTVEVYGENRGDVERFGEQDLGFIDCNTLRAGYPESKRTGEALCQAFRAQYGLEVVIPRLPRVYGPSMRVDDTKALSQFLVRAARGQDIVLKSEGTQFFSYCYVADAVAAVLTCMLAGEDGQAYNVADPSGDIHLKDLARLVADAAGTRVVFNLPDEVERRGYSTATRALMDGGKMASLGWRPMYDMEQGVERTLRVLKETMGLIADLRPTRPSSS